MARVVIPYTGPPTIVPWQDVIDINKFKSSDEFICQICAWIERFPWLKAFLITAYAPYKPGGRIPELKQCKLQAGKNGFFAVHHKDIFCSRACADRARMGDPDSKERKAYNKRKAAEMTRYRELHKTKGGRRKPTYY